MIATALLLIGEFARFTFDSDNNLNNLHCSDFTTPKNTFLCHGTLLNKNTIETFKNCDKVNILKEAGESLYDDITSGLCLEDPSRLVPFVLLSHAVSLPRLN